MNENILGQRIAALRRGAGMTQEQLAARLGVSFQAVSKWENALSCPDVTLLPLIAEVFGVSIDSLFGRGTDAAERQPVALAPATDAPAPVILRNIDEFPPYARPDVAALPWPDDDRFYFALFHGHLPIFDGPLSDGDPRERVEFCWEGPVRDLHSACGVRCGEVAGDVTAGGDVDCENVLGHLNAAGDVDCGDVAGNLHAGGDVDCGDVEGSVTAGGDVDCADVGGDVRADGDVDCADVGGNAAAGSDLDCADVGGNVTAGGDVECGDVNGAVVAGGGVTIQPSAFAPLQGGLSRERSERDWGVSCGPRRDPSVTALAGVAPRQLPLQGSQTPQSPPQAAATAPLAGEPGRGENRGGGGGRTAASRPYGIGGHRSRGRGKPLPYGERPKPERRADDIRHETVDKVDSLE